MPVERNLYLVVHHKADARPSRFINVWDDENENLLASISTTNEIGELCKAAKDKGKRIFIHRCTFGEIPNLICCSVFTASTNSIGGDGFFVEFENQEQLNDTPPCSPYLGQSFYWA